MTRRTVRFRVTGHVQGVGFRAFVLTLARDLGATGWVANASDGSVQGVATLSEDSLAAFREGLLSGPPGAHVEAVDVADEPLSAEGKGEFRIERDSL
ncbi:MAG: acylphosphatase [Leptospirillia bacterium]